MKKIFLALLCTINLTLSAAEQSDIKKLEDHLYLFQNKLNTLGSLLNPKPTPAYTPTPSPTGTYKILFLSAVPSYDTLRVQDFVQHFNVQNYKVMDWQSSENVSADKIVGVYTWGNRYQGLEYFKQGLNSNNIKGKPFLLLILSALPDIKTWEYDLNQLTEFLKTAGPSSTEALVIKYTDNWKTEPDNTAPFEKLKQFLK
jgi:hypothetical protein